MRLLIFAFLWTSATLAGALIVSTSGSGTLDRTVDGDNVKLILSSPFASLPHGGCAPLTIVIRNDNNGPGTWHVNFRTNALNNGFGESDYEQDLTVAPNATGTFHLNVPLAAAPLEDSVRFIATVDGPGFSAAQRNFGYFHTPGNASRTPFTVFGTQLIGPIALGPLDDYAKKHHEQLDASPVDAANLPSDWRAYTGVANLVLKDSEWLALDATQRDAIADAIALGGHLVIYTSPDPSQTPPQLQLPGHDGQYGYGHIDIKTVAAYPPDAATLASDLKGNASPGVHHTDVGYVNWPLRRLVGIIAVSGAFILCFVVLFGTLVGPVNLFYFAGGRNRMRLFWTTPVISLAASLALLVGILVTDGIGGSGRQIVATLSLPDRHREAVIQEQVARTAVLFSTGWHDTQNALVTPISDRYLSSLNDKNGGRNDRGNIDSTDVYRQSGNDYSGSWFRSRAVTGQYLQAVRPSRAALTIMNPTDFAKGLAPVVLSSFPEPLDRVYLHDTSSHYWTCENLEPGRKQTCQSSRGVDFDTFWNNTIANAGGKLRPFLNGLRDHPGTFFATGTPPEADRLNTLSQIRWTTPEGIYLGTWIDNPAPETTP